MTETRVPREVQRYIDMLRDKTGDSPVVNLDDRRWHLELTNGRVALTVTFKTTGPGRWSWAGSTLSIDGARRPIARSLEDFVRIYKNPDEADVVPVASPSPMPEAASVEDAPSDVGMYYRLFALNVDAQEALSGAVELGRDGRVWVVGYTGPGTSLRLRFEPTPGRSGQYRLSLKHGIELIIDGVNRTSDANGSLEQALSLLIDRPVQGVSEAPRIKRQSGPKTEANSVTVRRTTVIRT